MKNQVALIILDGFGINEDEYGNAVKLANMPNFRKYVNEWPSSQISASGMDVGLPDGQMGNSEVGHLNIGAGRIVYQELTRITKEIESGDILKNEAISNAIENASENGKKLHFMGLLSDGGVHSHIDHVKGLLDMCKSKGLLDVYVHAFLDGRDTPPQSAIVYIKELEDYMNENGIGKIATVSGRYYAMDRDNRWERVQLAYDAMVDGKGNTAYSAVEAVKESYENGANDEFVLPTVILNDNRPVASVEQGDSAVFFNFRPDRGRQLTRAFVDDGFKGFERNKVDTVFVTMTQYDATIENVDVAYRPQVLENTMGEYLSKNGKSQLRMAETEKYAHVTFFFNGGIEKPYEGEDRVLVSSPKVATYDMQPEMSAYEVAEKFEDAVDAKDYDFIVLNFANPDMVGHTGNMDAVVNALESVDECLGKVVDKILSKGGAAIITADHGNSEYMIDKETGQPFTAHTTNKVPFVIAGRECMEIKEGGRLCDIAPTVLELMGLEKPTEMTGESLVKQKCLVQN